MADEASGTVPGAATSYSVGMVNAASRSTLLRMGRLVLAGTLLAFVVCAANAAQAKNQDANRRLRQACLEERTRDVEQALQDGADVNGLDEKGQTVLTLLRAKECRSGETFASQEQTNIRTMIALLVAKGATEKDYLDFLLASTIPELAERREAVKEARKEYRTFMKARGLTRRKFNERQRERLSRNHETEHKGHFEAAYEAEGGLAYFRDSGRDWADWEDNGSLEEWDRKYYLKNGSIYFTTEKRLSGQDRPDVSEARTYWKGGKIVLVVRKALSGFWESMRPAEEQRTLADLPNLIDEQGQADLAALTKKYREEFDRSYQQVRDKLK